MKTKYIIFAFGLPLLGCRSATPAAETTTAPATTISDDAGACPTHETCAFPRGRVERLPVLVLDEHGGWTRVHETGTPTFALYDDGLVLFVEGAGKDARVRQAQLSRTDVDALVRDAHAKLEGLPDHIEGSTASDQPSVTIRVQTRGPTRDVLAWGIDRDGKATARGGSIPAAFVELYAMLRNFRVHDSVPWIPDEIAIRLHAIEGPRDATDWPHAVPLPPEGATEPPPFTHPDGKVMARAPIIYRIDGSLEDEVLHALAGLGDPPVVRWGGKTWAIHISRVVPG